jgi:carbonic anhydrase
VLGIMIEEGEANAAFNKFWLDLPRDADSEVHLDGEFNVLDILPVDLSAYRYDGSLTTPPCTEGVNWLVVQEPITMSAEQIVLFQSALRASCCEFNNRPTQPLNGREVLIDIGRD